jgi:hypothetical protein
MVIMAVLQKWDATLHGSLPSNSNELDGKYLLLSEVTQQEYIDRDLGIYGPKIASGECLLCLVEKYEFPIGEIVYTLATPQMIIDPSSLEHYAPDP